MPDGDDAQGASAYPWRRSDSRAPDGTKVPFISYPTPLYDASGAFVGAVNLLVRDRKRAEEFAQRLDS